MKTILVILLISCASVYGAGNEGPIHNSHPDAQHPQGQFDNSYLIYRLFNSAYHHDKVADYKAAPQFSGPAVAACSKVGVNMNGFAGAYDSLWDQFSEAMKTALKNASAQTLSDLNAACAAP